MALQDLTPQLRTRLRRVERVVGIFVILATLLLLTGFVYYVYHTAKSKGWWLLHVPYYTLMDSAAGLKIGDPVKLMGFDAGKITKITPNGPEDYFNVTIEFSIKEPYHGYLWTDSRVKVASAGFLGSRFLEVTKGGTSGTTNAVHATYTGTKSDLKIWIEPDKKNGLPGHYELYSNYTNSPKAFWLLADEPPALTEQLSRVITLVEQALPNILNLTNQVSGALTNSSGLLTSLQQTITNVNPLITNLVAISAQLRNPQGSLGDWLIPAQLNQRLQTTLSSANATINTADTNLNLLAGNLNHTLLNLADLTSNLNAQVQANSLMLSEISSLVVNADDFLQGLRRNWFLKASFQTGTNIPLQGIVHPGVGGAK